MMIKKIIKLLLTIFLGVFGVHKFMEGKKNLGILYLCTFGLFMFGWIIDIIKQGIDLFNEVNSIQNSKNTSNKSDELKLSQVENKINNSELEKKEFVCNVETKDYTSERIQEIIDNYIKNDYFDNDELYEGLKNDEITDVTYQIPNTSFAADIEEFEDSGKYGVYMKDYDGNNVFIGYIPKDKYLEFKKISLFGQNVKGGLVIKGGKYKTYDKTKEKVVTKKDNFIPKLNMIYYIEKESIIDKKMEQISKDEKEFNENYYIISTYITGRNYNNSDGSSRMEYISKLKDNDELLLEHYLYEGENALRILTIENKEIGNVPRDDISMIYKAMKANKIEKVEFKPRWYNGSITDYRIEVIVKR